MNKCKANCNNGKIKCRACDGFNEPNQCARCREELPPPPSMKPKNKGYAVYKDISAFPRSKPIKSKRAGITGGD